MADTTSEVAQRLYVSGPSDLEVRPLLDGLKRRGADPYVLSDVAPLGAGIVQSLRLAISQADRVLIVLTKAPALNPVLEVGIVLALGKPLLIIAAPGRPSPHTSRDSSSPKLSPMTSMPSTSPWIEQRRTRQGIVIATACPDPLDPRSDATGPRSCWRG